MYISGQLIPIDTNIYITQLLIIHKQKKTFFMGSKLFLL